MDCLAHAQEDSVGSMDWPCVSQRVEAVDGDALRFELGHRYWSVAERIAWHARKRTRSGGWIGPAYRNASRRLLVALSVLNLVPGTGQSPMGLPGTRARGLGRGDGLARRIATRRGG